MNESFERDVYFMMGFNFLFGQETIFYVQRHLPRPLREEEHADLYTFPETWAAGGFEISDEIRNYEDSHPILNISRFMKHYPNAFKLLCSLYEESVTYSLTPCMPSPGCVHLEIENDESDDE